MHIFHCLGHPGTGVAVLVVVIFNGATLAHTDRDIGITKAKITNVKNPTNSFLFSIPVYPSNIMLDSPPISIILLIGHILVTFRNFLRKFY